MRLVQFFLPILILYGESTPAKYLDRSSKFYELEREVAVKKIDWLLLNMHKDLATDYLSEYFVLDDLYYKHKKINCYFRIANLGFFSLDPNQQRRFFAEKIIVMIAKLRFFIPQIEAKFFTFKFFVSYSRSDFIDRYKLNIKGRKIYATLNEIASYDNGKLVDNPDNFPKIATANDPRPTEDDWRSYRIKELLISTIPKAHDHFQIFAIQYNAKSDSHTIEVLIEAKHSKYGQEKTFRRNKRPLQKEIMLEIAEIIRNLAIAVLPELSKDPTKVKLSFRTSDRMEEYAEIVGANVTIF